ncbi:cytochrome o ubiquinol oxidase subunit IV [Candidatus Protochlamydia sp. R18]|uniref:cytochrome o ubiquinol oxidase subunit IV n=1 Tax=Candidatus Protochlamydia sp. R18 TaxID=1353977 RepID=UPI0005A8B30B|nr:cytochrome o ubiquinol oxidase subunit IV [Candidatus Protochlamydia sp. R18]
MCHELNLDDVKKEWHGTIKSYVIGFTASLILTLLSFSFVFFKILNGQDLVYTLIGFALTQTFVQLVFFLHIGQEPKPRWESIALGFTILILLIVVIGSLWIMHDLNERMMGYMTQEMTHD